MLSSVVSMAEVGMAQLMSLLKFHADDYCELETTYGNALVAKDSSMGTVLWYEGFRTLVGRAEFEEFIENFSNRLDPYLSNRGHALQVVFFREDDPVEDIEHILQPCRDTIETLGLDWGDLLDEKRDIMRRFCMSEGVFFILWTRPAILDPSEVKLSRMERREFAQKYKVPGMENAQNILRPVSFMIDRHESFVEKVEQDLLELNCSVRIVEIHEAFSRMKRYLYRHTPINWRPALPGDQIIARWKNNSRKNDISELLYPRLEQQLFSAPAVNGNKNGVGGLTDTRAVRVGDRIFAPIMLKLPPQRPETFTQLFNALNNAGSKSSSGEVRRVPWSISFKIEGDGLRGIGLRKMFAGVLNWSSQSNKNLVAATEALQRYKNSGGTVVKMQVTALTWADYGEEKELMIRRSKLSRALAGWGSAVVEEETGDPTTALMAAAPGINLSSPAPAAAPPLPDLSYMLPLARPASPFFRGTTLLRTLDGKLMPYEVFSDQQNTWITLLFGGPGSGKSVFANRLNTEMCMLGGLNRLPFICVIDIGISSSGFISLVKDALPEDKRYLAIYERIQNTEKYRVNQFDCQLGCRQPLPREREFMKNFLVLLATPPDRVDKSTGEMLPHRYMDVFCGDVIDLAFIKKSDKHERGQPNKFSLRQNDFIAEKVIEHNIPYSEISNWWDIVDGFKDRGLFYEASVAQRYCSPTLFDMLNAAAELANSKEELKKALDDGMPVTDEFSLMIRAATDSYPIFNGVTMFDVGESRVMALDLQDVVAQGSNAAKKQASLMYMMAINAFTRKITICKEDLDSVNQEYRAYHARRVDELAEDYKRLFCDEYHKTGNASQLREGFLIYGRESRKWNLELVLGSQLPDDFDKLADVATSTLILDSGNQQTRGTIARIFGLSPTEVAALRQYVHGAKPGVGMTFLAKIKTKSAELSQLFTSTSGGLELWGLSTTAEDRALRNLLYRDVPAPEARAVLKRRFPTGSCKSFVLKEKERSREEKGDQFVDDDVTSSVIENLAKSLKKEWLELHEAGAFA